MKRSGYLHSKLRAYRKQLISNALTASNNNMTCAAKLLKINPGNLQTIIKTEQISINPILNEDGGLKRIEYRQALTRFNEIEGEATHVK